MKNIGRIRKEIHKLLECSDFNLYVLAILVIVGQFAVLYNDIVLTFYENAKLIPFLLRSVVDSLLLLILFWIVPSKYRRCMIWIVILLFTIWSLSQLWYFRTYNDLMPFTSYLLFDNVSALLVDSVIGSMKMIDLLIVVPVIFLFLLDRFYLKKMKRGSISKVIKGLCISAIIFVSLSMYLTFGVTYYWNEKGKLVTSIWEDILMELIIYTISS